MSARQPEGLTPAVIGLALIVVAIWGFNFVVIKVGVSGMPPLFLACLRFLLCVFPAIFFVPRPSISWGRLAAYGIFLGVGEFGLLFTAIKLGAPAGLASIALQAQAFFTAILAAVFLGETIRMRTWAGLALAATGLVLLMLPQARAAASLSPPLVGMLLLAGFFWASANLTAKAASGTGGQNSALGLVVWSSLFSPLPLLALSLVFEGTAAISASLRSITILTIGAILFLAVLSTLVGYGIWNALIMRYGASRIAPFSLLVPIFGLSSASVLLGERFTALDGVAAALVLGGLGVHLFWPLRKPVS